ncbi:MAG TPA: hypothetical protein VK634_17095 [Reyranella sp.]|nr:hypothetical protein [Reyranella sp.]HTE82404.1 hypothetical protein [Reyranella sp.]
MDDIDLGGPGAGHNSGEKPSLLQSTTALIETANRWIIERPVILDEAMSKKATDFFTQLRDMGVALKAERDKLEEPLKREVAAIHARYADPLTLIDMALKPLRAASSAWLDKEKARLAAEKAEQDAAAKRLRDEALRLTQQAAEEQFTPGSNYLETQLRADHFAKSARAAEKVAARKIEPARARGDFAPRALALHTRWAARIVDEVLALKFYAKHPVVRAAAVEAALKLANAEARTAKDAAKAPPGVEFFSTRQAA